MANSNISAIGRFSSQMLTYLGAQRTVKGSGAGPVNTFKYSTGPTVFPPPGSISQAALGEGVVGNYSPDVYNSTKCYFMSRGAGVMYADTMTALAIDISATIGVPIQLVLEQAFSEGKIMFTDEAYRAFNIFRDPGNQVGIVTSVDNRYSLQAREIRS